MFLIRPIPLAHEHILSYLLRITQSNGYKRINQILQCCGMHLTNGRVPYKKIFMGDFDLTLLSNCGGRSITELKLILCCAFDTGTIDIAGFKTYKHLVRFGNPRFCPECIKECGFYPTKFLLLPFTYCTKHARFLLDTIPNTGKSLAWSTEYLWEILQGTFDSSSQPPNVDEETTKLNALIDKLYENSISGFTIDKETTFQINDFLLLLHFIAHYHHRQYCQHRLYTTLAKNFELTNFYTAAYTYIEQWPEPFFKLLHSFEKHPMSHLSQSGLRACFRDLYDELYTGFQANSGAYKFLRHYFEVYLKHHFSNTALMASCTWLDEDTLDNSLLINETNTAIVLGCSLSRVKIFQRQNLLKSTRLTKSKGNSFYRNDVMRLKTKLLDFITIEQTANHFKLSLYHTRLLLRENIIAHVLSPDKHNRDWLIPLKSVKSLIKSLHANMLDTAPVGTVSKTFKQLSFKGQDTITLIQNMLSKEQPYILIRDEESPLSMQQFRACISEKWQPELYVRPKEASEQLNVNINAIYNFFKKGFLRERKCLTGRTARPIKLVSCKSLDRFKSLYFLRHQIPAHKISMFKLISGPKVDAGIVNIYTRK
jgi:hypothetical protein